MLVEDSFLIAKMDEKVHKIAAAMVPLIALRISP